MMFTVSMLFFLSVRREYYGNVKNKQSHINEELIYVCGCMCVCFVLFYYLFRLVSSSAWFFHRLNLPFLWVRNVLTIIDIVYVHA